MPRQINLSERIQKLEEMYNVIEYKKNKSGEIQYTVTCKQCGTEYKKTYSQLLKGCIKCRKKEEAVNKFQQKINQKFGENKYKVVEYTNSDTKAKVKCLECDSIIEFKPSDLNRKKYICEKCFKQQDLEKRKQEWLNKFYNKQEHENYQIVECDYQGSQEKTIKMKCLIHNIEYVARPEEIIRTKGFSCPKCRYEITSKSKRKPLKIYIDQLKQIHPEYDYSKNDLDKLVTKSDKIVVICPKHGEFNPSIGNHLDLKTKCPKCAIEEQGINRRYPYEEIKKNIKQSLNDHIELVSINHTNNIRTTTVVLRCKKHNNTYTKRYSTVINSKYNGCEYCMKEFNKEKYIKELHIKIKQKCLETNCDLISDLTDVTSSNQIIVLRCKKHNVIFDRRINNFIQGNTSGCNECISEKLRCSQYSYDEVCEMINKFHPKLEILDENRNNFINTSSIFKIRCPKHGIFKRSVSTLIYERYGCPRCANSVSNQEQELQKFISSIYKDDIIFNNRTIIKPKELDIYVPDLQLAIEYNGVLFHSFGKSYPNNWNVFDKYYHYDKTNKCEQNNIQLLQIFSNEWIDPVKKEIWKSVIKSKMNLIDSKIYARNCIIKEINHKNAHNFFEQNHLQGNSNASIYIGLFYNDELVSVMSFNKSRFTNKYEYELIRFANKINTVVVGGASKLLKYFIKKYKPRSIISYANRRWSNGNLYKKLNFKLVGKTQPNYFYIDKDQKIYSRIHFQKHKLKEYYEKGLYNINSFDETKSEIENMINNGYRIIFDSGNYVFEYIPEIN